MDDVLELFEGLTPKQAETFTKLILPTLRNLRQEVVWLDQHADEIVQAASDLGESK